VGYSSDDSDVRVDFFKESGKWYATESIKMENWDEPSFHDAFKHALNEALYMPKADRLRYSDMTAVCLEPYHKHSHPIMLRLPAMGKFKVELQNSSSWTRKYNQDDLVEIQVCESPDEWESGEVVAVDENTVSVRMLYATGPRVLVHESAEGIRPAE